MSVPSWPARTSDLAAVRAELDGVVDEIDDDLAEPGRVAADRRQAVGRLDPERDALAIGEQPQPLRRLRREPTHVQAVDEREGAAALDARQVEQLVDHLDEVAGLDLDLADPVAHLGWQPDVRSPRPRATASRPAGSRSSAASAARATGCR